ncbi:MAG: flavocytochrome c [Pygmaiobacter sp.]|nr:flavocytochrome c [Pygmaiobacter sp.]
MKKKILSAVLSLVMLFSLAGCGAQSASSTAGATYKAGTYSATVQGHNAELTVTTEFDDNSIVAVTIGDNAETQGIATPVLETFPGLIVDGQTLNIDAVSGATVSSKAVLEAVAQCVEQAGGDAEALKTKEKVVKTAGEPIEKTADVVVIGAGGAGLSAAVSASSTGSSVIVIEKGAAVGGNTLRAGGAYNAVDPERQGNVAIEDSQITELERILAVDPATADAEYQDTLKTLQSQIKEYLAGDKKMLFDTVELHTYQTYMGGKRTGIDGTTIYGDYDLVHTLTSNSLSALEWVASLDENVEISDNIGTVLGALWPRTHSLTASVGHGMIDPLMKGCEANNVEIMLNTAGESLIVEDGKVVGVKATQADGTPVTLTATKGVILTTGGYGANPKMAMEYDNYWGILTEDMPTTNSALLTGDGIVMAKAVNANLVGMGYIQLMPSSQPVTGSLGGGLWGSAEDQVFVNKEGKRFVSEYESRDVLSKAALEQTDGIFYIICDQESAGNPQPGAKNGWGNDIDTLIEEGSVLKADTLEDLATQMGCDPATFVAEIEKYNSFTETGVDTDFNKVNIGAAIDVGPFYATIRTPSIHHTMGGVQINTNAEVLDTDGNVIKGLYAAGEVVGGIHAGNRLGGNALADVVVFGRIAGASAAANG